MVRDMTERSISAMRTICLSLREWWTEREAIDHDLQDFTPITPAMFLCDKPSLETADLDMLDGNHVRKRRRFGVKMMKELRERFRREYLGQSVQHHLQDPQPSNI
ncbi:DUF5641 domain-containing protein [Trichonephila clavipes]|nr:DUF5641 domain-containing protein [Trichonephila clavipes]